jgi:hypothetical protein
MVGDPHRLAERLDLKKPAPELRLGLGLDLGTSTGYSYTWFDPAKAWIHTDHPIYVGQLDLSVGDHDSGAIRYVRLRQFLTAFDPDIVFFEDTHGGGQAVGNFGPHPKPAQVVARVARPIELLGGLKATVGAWCEERSIPCAGFSIQAIKRRATNRGNANKPQIIAAANEEYGLDLPVEEHEKTGADNMADSLYCLVLGLESYSRGV